MLDVTLAAVLGDLATWHKLPTPVPTVSLNLSPRQALTDSLPERLLNAVRVQDLPANALRVEVPEAAMTENEPMMIRVIGQLRAAGIRTSLDDFGTGHATLTALSRVPIDMLQLDHSLVADLGASERARTIAQAVIAMAHGLGMLVTAEGIETGEQLAVLRTLGCDMGQGHLFRAAGPGPAHSDDQATAELWAALGNDVLLSESGPKGTPGVDS